MLEMMWAISGVVMLGVLACLILLAWNSILATTIPIF